jgi:hypothetical protein
MSPRKLTRRQWGAALVAAAPVVAAQTVSPEDAPAKLLESALAGNKRTAEKLAAVKLPMSTEPAFSFRAQ